MNGRRTIIGFAVAAGLALAGFGCAGGGDAAGSRGDESVAGRAAEGAPGLSAADRSAFVEPEGAAGDSAGGSVDESLQELPSPSAHVIKTADVEIRVEHGGFADAFRLAGSIASRYGGFVTSSSTGAGEAGYGTVVMRVPSARFEDALDAVQRLGTKVLRREISGQDVTEEFIDLEARLRNFEAQETVLLDLMKKARSVADTIRVQRELQGVQLEVERIEGRLRYLRDQTEMSTITVALSEAGAGPARLGRIERAWRDAIDTFVGMVAGLVAGLGFIVPLGAIAVVGLVIFRRRGALRSAH